MKILNVILLILVSATLTAQTVAEDLFPTKDGKIQYQEVVKVDSTVTAKTLYLNGKKWLTTAFKSAKDVIQLDDSDSKTIVAKGFIKNGHTIAALNPKKWFTLRLEFKDGRYRYTLTDLVYEFDANIVGTIEHYEKPLETWLKYSNYNNPKKREKGNKKVIEYAKSIDTQLKAIIESLKDSMIQTQTEDKW